MEEDEEMLGEMESGRCFVRKFVAGLNGLQQCKLLVPEHCQEEEDIAFLHVLFESQNEILITKMLGNESTIRTIDTEKIYTSPHDAFVLGYCISLSRCQWELNLYYINDEHIDMMNRAIDNRGCGNGRIIEILLCECELTNDGMSHLLSLP